MLFLQNSQLFLVLQKRVPQSNTPHRQYPLLLLLYLSLSSFWRALYKMGNCGTKVSDDKKMGEAQEKAREKEIHEEVSGNAMKA